MDFAEREGIVIVSQDSDLTNLLFHRQADSPSPIPLRDVQEVAAADIAALLLNNLDQIHDALERGAVVSMVSDRVHVRRLPIQH